MFGATLLVPLLTGFPVNTTLLFSGVGTIVFLLITRNRLPSYLGSSFAFIAPLTATSAQESALNSGVVVSAGIALMLVGVAVKAAGRAVLDAVMPPVVTGAIVALIGLNLAPAATKNFAEQPIIAFVTMAVIIVATVAGRGMIARLRCAYWCHRGLGVRCPNWRVVSGITRERCRCGMVWATGISCAGVSTQCRAGRPASNCGLVAQNVGHVKAVAAMTGKNLDDIAGDALIADGMATTLAGSFGGSGTTTYAENIV